jgi:hypothetical protein
MSQQEIVALIDALRERGVAHFKSAAFEVTFGGPVYVHRELPADVDPEELRGTEKPRENWRGFDLERDLNL